MRNNEDIKKIEDRRIKIDGSEEWTNFTTLIDESRRLFNPDAATLQRQVSKGSLIRDRRVSDVGVSFLNDYAAGVVSLMMTSGEEWFKIDAEDVRGEEAEELMRQTSIMRNALDSSRFVSETGGAVLCAGCDGSVCEYVERGADGRLRFCKVPFGSFWFDTDYHGVPSLVWIEKKTSIGALASYYGKEKLSAVLSGKLEATPEEEVCVIYYCAPRKNRDKKKIDTLNKEFEVLVYEKGEKHLLEEGGSDSQMFHVYRTALTGNERLGRGPCLNSMSTMNEIEQVIKDMRNSRRLKVVPTLALPASQGLNSYKWIHEQYCSYLVYNDSGLSGHPPQQIISPADINEGEEWVEWLMKLMRGAFFLDYFNPLQDRRNMTLGEAKERVQKSYQMVSSVIEPLVKELLTPLMKRTYQLMGAGGAFDSDEIKWMDIQEKFKGRLNIVFTSKLANSQRMVQLASDLEAAQQMMFVAQAIPEPFLLEYAAQIDWARYPKRIIEGTNADKSLLRDEEKAKEIIEGFAQAQAQAQQTEMADKQAGTVQKLSKAPEQGSPAGQFMQTQI